LKVQTPQTLGRQPKLRRQVPGLDYWKRFGLQPFPAVRHQLLF
jgi:hypothetical protein